MEFIFGKIDVLAVLVFIFATLAVTELLKKVFGKIIWFCKLLEIGFFKLCLSWIVGAFAFVVLHLTFHSFPVTEATVLQFLIWTALLNGGYKIVTTVLGYLKEMRK